MKTIFLKTLSILAIALLITSCNKNTTSPSSSQSTPSSQRAGRNGQKPEFKDVLARVDTNNDGKISKSEAKGPLVNVFEKLDADGDGFITEKEFNEFTPPAQR